jgi:predicted aspartyl protease
MVVRVKLRVSRGDRAKVVTVLVSSGAESEEPVVVLKPEDAVELGFSLRSDFDIIEVELASGKTQCFISKRRLK